MFVHCLTIQRVDCGGTARSSHSSYILNDRRSFDNFLDYSWPTKTSVRCTSTSNNASINCYLLENSLKIRGLSCFWALSGVGDINYTFSSVVYLTFFLLRRKLSEMNKKITPRRHIYTHIVRLSFGSDKWSEWWHPAGVDISYWVDPSVHKDGLIGADETGRGNHAHGPIIIPL